jgi:prefoldin subunit 5
MKDIHEVLRRKQAQYAQLTKQIEALQAAADKLREVAPLLADGDEEIAPATVEESAEESRPVSAKAAAAAPASANSTGKIPVRGTAPRWP